MSPKVLIDQVELATRPSATWADLLQQIEDALDARGDVISEVRFDAVEQQDYREAATLRRSLDDIATVEINAVPPAVLLARGLREAIASIDPIQRGARDLAIGYRKGEVNESNQRLGVLAEAIGNLMTIVSAAQKVLNVDLMTVTVDDASSAVVIGELDTAIAAIGDAHRTRDWVTLADLLEYDVVPVLPRLGRVIEQLTTIPLPRSR